MTFKHLSVSTALSVIATFGLVACGGGGGSSSTAAVTAPPTPTPPADTSSPSVTFSPTTLTVVSSETGTSTVSATDNVGVTAGPTVNCTNGGSFSGGVFTAPSVTSDMTSICTATAEDAAGNSGEATLTVTITPPPDTTAPIVTFSPETLTVVSGMTGTATVTATDDVEVTSGPDVTCTNGGSFVGDVFTAPTVTTNTTIVCTATAEDAAGNSGEANLTVTVSQPVSAFFQNTSDTITIAPVLGLGQTFEGLFGVTRNAAGTVSTFAATASGFGIFDDPVITAQPTLGTVGSPPLHIFSTELEGQVDGIRDMVFLDQVNDQLVGITLNADNTFGAPVTQSVPNSCDAGRGSGARFIQSGDDTTRDDILVGTSNGLFYIAAGDADGTRRSGLSAPIQLVADGNFCNLIVASSGLGNTGYAVYNSTTSIISGFEGDNSDADSYTEQFTADLSGQISTGLAPLLFDAFSGTFRFETIVTVFENPQLDGSIVSISDVGVTPETEIINTVIESPTDMLLFNRDSSDDIILVSPTSENAVYIRDNFPFGRVVELIEIGLGFDQVDLVAGAVAFSSSTQADIVIRSLQ